MVHDENREREVYPMRYQLLLAKGVNDVGPHEQVMSATRGVLIYPASIVGERIVIRCT